MTAPGTRFGCPQCGLKLRIQANSAIERRIVCPRCQAPLRVRFEPLTGTVEVQSAGPLAQPTLSPADSTAAGPAPQQPGPTPPPSSAAPQPGERPADGPHCPVPLDDASRQDHSRPADRSLSGTIPAKRWWLVAGGLGGLLLLGIGAWALWRGPGDGPRSTESEPAVAHGDVAAPAAPANSATIPTGPAKTAGSTAELPADVQPDPNQLVLERLTGLQTPIGRVIELTDSFPPAVVGDASRSIGSRLSWLAVLAHQMEDNPPAVDWNSDWNTPVNDRFVRRRLVQFQNPLMTQLTGDDGYPAGHFVGVAGVGPEVLRPEPSANQVGVFAPDRRVSLAQIRDGLAQTAVVTGVQSQFGSWGAGGRPTIRSFQSPPVIGGPDGLGTGQAESLLLLMADGRVQPVAADVDPEVFRRMLTIAGEVLEENPTEPDDAAPQELVVSPAEPVDPPANIPLAESATLWDDDDQPPLSPEFAGDDEQPRRQVNPRVALAQKLVQFDQPVRSRREVLWGVRDLVGVPLRFEGGDVETRLKETVGFTLRDVTVQQVLERTLAESGLGWRIERGQLVVFVTDNPSGKQ